MPPELVRRLREVIKATEDVGRRFPDEARKIHYDEVPARAIRGQASPEEAESLREEGIEFTVAAAVPHPRPALRVADGAPVAPARGADARAGLGRAWPIEYNRTLCCRGGVSSVGRAADF